MTPHDPDNTMGVAPGALGPGLFAGLCFFAFFCWSIWEGVSS